MTALIIIAILFFLWRKYKPVIEYIPESELLVLYYNGKQTRKMFILWDNN